MVKLYQTLSTEMVDADRRHGNELKDMQKSHLEDLEALGRRIDDKQLGEEARVKELAMVQESKVKADLEVLQLKTQLEAANELHPKVKSVKI